MLTMTFSSYSIDIMNVATSSRRTCTDSAISPDIALGCPSASGRVMENTVKLGIPRSRLMSARGLASRMSVISSWPFGGETYAVLVASTICLCSEKPKNKRFVAGDLPHLVEAGRDQAVCVIQAPVAHLSGESEIVRPQRRVQVQNPEPCSGIGEHVLADVAPHDIVVRGQTVKFSAPRIRRA